MTEHSRLSTWSATKLLPRNPLEQCVLCEQFNVNCDCDPEDLMEFYPVETPIDESHLGESIKVVSSMDQLRDIEGRDYCISYVTDQHQFMMRLNGEWRYVMTDTPWRPTPPMAPPPVQIENTTRREPRPPNIKDKYAKGHTKVVGGITWEWMNGYWREKL